MTRADIGDFLGLTIETVSRTFTKLKQLDLIELPCSNQVRLLDIAALKGLADGEQENRFEHRTGWRLDARRVLPSQGRELARPALSGLGR
jgi:DNA-binding transcriptional regulator LsrR (DeoR family)